MLQSRRDGLYRMAIAEREAYYTLQVGAVGEQGKLTLASCCVRARRVAAAAAASERGRKRSAPLVVSGTGMKAPSYAASRLQTASPLPLLP